MTLWWEGGVALSDGDTATGSVDGRTWTVSGDDIRLVGASGSETLRVDLANAVADQVTTLWEIAVTPYPPTQASPPHIWVEPADPFFEWGTFGAYVWAYNLKLAVPAGHSYSWDWFERVAPLLVTACSNVPGSRLETMSAPTESDVGEGRRYLTSDALVTIKRNR